MQSIVIQNLKINLEFIEVFFKYLPFEKKGDLNYSFTYFYHDTYDFKSICEVVSFIERNIEYKTNKNGEINISAEIGVEQEVIINENEINLSYYGLFSLYNPVASIVWNRYQKEHEIFLQLDETIPMSKIITLYENFQTAIKTSTYHE